MVAGDRKLVHTPFVHSGYWSPCEPLIWNPVKAPDIRFSSSQFRKQHPGHEKANIAHLQHVNDESCTQGSSSVQPVKNDSLRPMFGASDELSLFSACGLGADSSSFVQASKNTSKKLVSSNTVQPPTFPLQPEWIYSRETLWDDFLSISPNSEGNQGVYIKPLPLSNRYAVRCFKVDEKMSTSVLRSYVHSLKISIVSDIH
ncbi:unnamed protein product [Schistosoma margrebowiei]|uniref:Uncharacterized protein n=1 Tax=Schistosoma margrebowiei TaxID=48269 RepID=A0A183N501_9TREM|nr:unnamed protein product [Schistosoma margrebowiei]